MENIRLQSLQILYTFVLRLPQNGRTSGEFAKIKIQFKRGMVHDVAALEH